MKLLLDTHTFLWFIEGNSNLSENARSLIDNVDNQTFLSIAGLWEVAIKVSLGKLAFDPPFERLIPQQLILNDIKILNIDLRHIGVIARLPFHHRDPFDRILVAQASVGKMPIVSADRMFDQYDVTRIW